MLDVRIARLCLDINVFYADLAGRAFRVRPSACSDLVEYVTSGTSPAGGVQLIISVPMIEQWQNVLRRHFGFPEPKAHELSSLLYSYACDGPIPTPPLIVVGSDFVPFASEAEMLREASRISREAGDRGADKIQKLFDEIDDDRHVLLAALAGRADVLATANIKDFRRHKFIEYNRDDMIVIPRADRHLVIAKPSFVNYWLRDGVVPNWNFVVERPDEFFPVASVEALGATRGTG